MIFSSLHINIFLQLLWTFFYHIYLLHSVIFWIGDLNYRIDTQPPLSRLTNERVRLLAKNGDFTELLAADQLKRTQREGKAFPFFEEHSINFRPTYKFDTGGDLYDTRFGTVGG